MIVSNELLLFQKMGDRFKEFVHYIGGRFNHVATRTSTCIIPRLNMTKPGVTRNNLRVNLRPFVETVSN